MFRGIFLYDRPQVHWQSTQYMGGHAKWRGPHTGGVGNTSMPMALMGPVSSTALVLIAATRFTTFPPRLVPCLLVVDRSCNAMHEVPLHIADVTLNCNACHYAHCSHLWFESDRVEKRDMDYLGILLYCVLPSLLSPPRCTLHCKSSQAHIVRSFD